ncbi:MAG: ATP-binding cassette domain-containing protein [Alphaproteobacteria bacterium]|nr:ATP-binding cassette domain-containing protein [Alphaproteobacteria bacterium]
MSSIRFEGVSKFYEKNIALDGVTTNIPNGSFVTLVGHSGSGKSTLFKIILGEESPDEGIIYRDEKPLHVMASEELLTHRRRTGVVFQDFRLLNSKTVYENIAFAMEVLGFDDEHIYSDVPYVLGLVDLKKKMWSFPHQLSGGEKQRVAIARAIVNQPELLLADEPTGNLDPLNTYEVINILKQINKLGTTIILATHDREVVESIGGRVITMNSGQMVMDDAKGKYIL